MCEECASRADMEVSDLRRLLELVRDRPDWASVQSIRDTVRVELDRLPQA
jgi:hypothetical protein